MFEPQELDLLGSQPSPYCLMFRGSHFDSSVSPQRPNKDSTWLSPTTSWYFNITVYCNGSVWPVDNPPQESRAFPSGTFLICGDKAWPGVPSKPVGGPCYFGKLTMFAPSIQQLLNITHKRARRSALPLDPNCRDDMQLWKIPAVFFASLLAPGAASARALTQLRRLASWTGKQANVTSHLIGELVADVDSLRHTLLQNRAAIDFLLLAHGHGCKDIEGMCCFNLADHSKSIHSQLQWLTEHTKKLTVQDSPFDRWFQGTFGGLGVWAISLIKEGLRWVGIILLLLLGARIISSCLAKHVDRLTQGVLLAQTNINGGIVRDWLREKGHIDSGYTDSLQLTDLRSWLRENGHIGPCSWLSKVS
ncbi:syncytin-A-like [Corvus kubaryi]|uniref:syncytin-A-like n=1 Tax=Corvus kubaryi TaxID=68294 RepID=UPI001C05C751|nr:syncytin-A-like [Corvus kubaryi]